MGQNGRPHRYNLAHYEKFLAEDKLQKDPMLATKLQPVSRTEIFIVVCFFISICVLSHLFQPLINADNGRGFDGSYYCQMAERMLAHIKYEGLKPQAYCLGGPFLAGLADSKDVLHGFLIVNVTASFLIVLLLTFWLGIWVKDRRVRLFLNLLFQTNWCGPVRFVWFYTALQDYWPVVFILASLILMAKSKDLLKTSLAVSLLSFVGIFFREVVFIVPFAFLFVGFRWNEPFGSFFENIGVKLLPLLSAGAAWAIVLHSVTMAPDNPWSYSQTIHDLLAHPQFDRSILSWLDALGPLLVVLLMRPKRVFLFFRDNIFIFACFLGIAAMIFVSSAEERFFMMLAPTVYLLVGVVFQSGWTLLRWWPVAGLLLGFQLVAHRVFWATPPQLTNGSNSGLSVFLTPVGKNVNYLDLFSWYNKPDVIEKQLTQYFWLFILFLSAQWFMDLRDKWSKKIVKMDKKPNGSTVARKAGIQRVSKRGKAKKK